ncbi:essential recombination function protein [Microcystis phage Mae-JY35]
MTESKNVHQRLAAAMEEVDYIQKERKQGMNYTIVSHDAVTAKVRPVLLKNGIVYYPVRCEHIHNGNRAECAMTVRFVNIDAPADFFDVPTFGYGIDTQDKGPGKAMSYAVKYALLKALGLETGDDPDTEAAEFSPRDAHQPAKPVEAKTTKADARPTYALLEKDMRLNKSKADLQRWIKDPDVKALRAKLTPDWDKNLLQAAADYGRDLPEETPAEDVFPGDVSQDIRDQLARHPLAAG